MRAKIIMKAVGLVLLLTFINMGAQAQISNEVVDVMKKCEAAMDSPKGMKVDMDLNAGIAFFKMKGTVTSYTKGDLSLCIMKGKMMGRVMIEESGYDGKQEWEYTKEGKENSPATLTITPVSDKNKESDYDIDLEMHKEYKKAKMKEKDDRFVITFTEPKSKESPKKTVIDISKDKYLVCKITLHEKGVTAEMTVKKITFGVSDSVFKLDMNRYKGAKVIRK